MTEGTLAVTRNTHSSGATVLTVTGDLDHHTAPQLSGPLGAIRLAPDDHLVMDLTGLEYCDSTGVTVLITAYQHAQSANCPLTLVGVNDNLRRIFRIIGLESIFTFQPTIENAVQTTSA
ncbi:MULTISPECIES: STAS domain-containing protein [unclassified Streptomyces]|uniref:STAS domain-containing protein n=1 Tax=unclassified Streptomyces TaxID=2593676 RepID=UPI002E326AA6|nr:MULTISPECIES: STAS domain-containing protein [unclassified Streptomyces]WUC62871.1 STAS domain-containing protein [Streptomyces sp. NBC_00539]